MFTELRSIAVVSKTHGKRGEVVAVPVDGLPPLLRVGLEVCVVPPELRGRRWHRVLSADDRPGGQLVLLDDLSDLSDAESLAGKALLARVSDLPDDLDMMDAVALVGRVVADASHGALGIIDEVMRGPANDVWVVHDGSRETLVPAVDAFVLGFDEDGVICVDLPDGLVGGGDD